LESEANNRDYYCSMKFRYMKVDLESQTTYSCHAAYPHKINFDWLQNNQTNLFNHDINVQERQMMLANQRAPSCEQNCWHAEDRGQISPRIYQHGQDKTHFEIKTSPEILDLTLGGDCNLTCTYCCKEFSSAWRRDIKEHGEYPLSSLHLDRYELSNRDLALMQVNQPRLLQSKRYRILLNEIKSVSSTVMRLDVTGGEPFLNNQIVQLLNELNLPEKSVIDLYTGLGVDNSRLNRILDKLKDNKKLHLSVSCENIDQYLEFNRYGVRWKQFEDNLKSIIDRQISFHFHSTVSNLTAFGFAEFCDYYQDHNIKLTFAYQPRMQSLHVLDPESKHNLDKSFARLPENFQKKLAATISPQPTENERADLSRFLSEFIRRRPNLDLKIYPQSFLHWLGL
jgi:organic radical activating enzyme